MRINLKNLTLILIAVSIIGFGVAGYIVKAKGIDATFGIGKQQRIDTQKSTDGTGIENIAIDAIDADIHVTPVNTKTITAHLYGTAALNSSSTFELVSTVTNSTLQITEKQQGRFLIGTNFDDSKLKLDVTVPMSYVNNLKISTVAGPITAENLTVDALSCDTVSGDVTFSAMHTHATTCKTTSGGIALKEFTGDLSLNSVSGDLSVAYMTFDNNVHINTVSGNTSITLPKSSQFKVAFSTVSGELVNSFPFSIQGNADRTDLSGSVGSSNKTITFQSVSGNEKITN